MSIRELGQVGSIHGLRSASTMFFREMLFPRTVAYYNRAKQELASGTLISIGSRLFVATASHAIPDENSHIWLFGVGRSEFRTDPAEAYPGLIKCGKNLNDKPDVGYLELEPTFALADLNAQAWLLERLGILGPGREESPVLLVGNPVQNAKFSPETDTAPERLDVVNVYYLTTPLMPGDWPKAIAEPGDPEFDIFLKYPDAEARDMVTGNPMFLPHPGGMSGGGIWDQGFERRSMWSPDGARLFAFQSAWYERSRYVRGVQVIHWLRLIHREYPDLRGTIEGSFPDVVV